jgi:hypothetical protein
MRRLFLNRSEPAKKSGQNIPKNRCRTTIAERMTETLAELPFIGDQVVCLSHEPSRPQRNAIPRAPRLEDLGNLELKGLRRPVAAFNVVQSSSSAEARPNLTVVARGPGGLIPG